MRARRLAVAPILAVTVLRLAACRPAPSPDRDSDAGPLAVDASARIGVELGANGKLVYRHDASGDGIPDFSHAGFGGGGVRLPNVATLITISPRPGDDAANIQAALDSAGALPLGLDGFRGAVVLRAGAYDIAGSVVLDRSGVVLRGEGQGTDGTVLTATGSSTRDLIRIEGTGGRTEIAGSRRPITSAYVPVGATRFDVDDAAGFARGDHVLVLHQTNQDWIDAIGADDCTTRGGPYDTADVSGVTCLDVPWTPSPSAGTAYERTVTEVSGQTVTIDVPLVQALDANFGGGALARYAAAGRLQNCGVENLRGESAFRSVEDDDHASYLVALREVEDAWVRDVTAASFAFGAVRLSAGSRRITVQDAASVDPISALASDRRYPFHIDGGQQVLVQRCRSRRARHDFSTGRAVAGPNVFLDNTAEECLGTSGPRRGYATGTLYDNVVHHAFQRGAMLGVEQRGNGGGGDGWTGAQQMFWNCVSDEHKVEEVSRVFHNWSFGSRASILLPQPAGAGEIESFQVPLVPRSLYLQQLQDRLGPQAVDAITRR